MAAAKEIERTYNVPLRKEYRKVPRWRKTKKAAKALREFLVKHMKSDNVKLGIDVNDELWKHGIRNPPHHIKVIAKKDDKGEVKVSLFAPNRSLKVPKVKKAEPKKTSEKKPEEKPVKTAKTE
jgi:large subunit ribosomal protein L31e